MSLIHLATSALSRSYPCRAFYDSIGDTLSVGIKQKGKFHSYIEGEYFSFDLTRDGKLLNIDVWKPKKEWTVEKKIHPPEEFEKENIVFLDLRQKAEPIAFLTDAKNTLLYLRFAAERVSSFVSPAGSLIFELNSKKELVGLWITQIEEDVNFQKEGEWRRTIKAV